MGAILPIRRAPCFHRSIRPYSTHCAGVYNDMIRLSAGLESIEDLKEKFAQAIL